MPCCMLCFWQNILNLSEMKLILASDIILHGNLYFENMLLQQLISCSANRPSALFIYWKSAVVIYNAKEMAVIQSKSVSTKYFPWFACYIMPITLFWVGSLGSPIQLKHL